MTVQENIVLKIAVLMNKNNSDGAIEIGKKLLRIGSDRICDGGFWVWGIQGEVEFYSPKFRNSLGFKGESDFPSLPNSWMEQIDKEDMDVAIDNYNKVVSGEKDSSYYQVVNYTKKDGSRMKVTCSGTLIRDKKGEPQFLVGTHIIL